MITRDWKSIETAKALVIGHDPRLQKSDAIAQYALFADYYFKEEPTSPSEKRKYGLAKATFDHIKYLTNNKINPNTIYITNLCNCVLTHAPKGKTVLIPENEAQKGFQNILQILYDNPTIMYIFPMSLQVNYWLQKLGFYTSGDNFLVKSEPRDRGIKNYNPYFEPKNSKTFLMICGKKIKPTEGFQDIIPILHSKQYPLTDRTAEYKVAYERIKSYFSE